MTRVSVFAIVATLAVSVAAHGPHYLPNHDELIKRDEINLLHKKSARMSGAHRLKRRSRRAKRDSCNAKSSSASSSSSDSTSDNTTSDSSTSSADTAKSSSSSDSSSSSNGSSSSSSSSSSSVAHASLKKLGISQFLGTNGPTIGSWFRTDASSDSTNGNSWCGFPYKDYTNGFAPDVSLMLNNFGGDYNTAATAYCGQEAIVTNTKTGVQKTMYIVDGFDPKWVKKAGAIDIVKDQYTALNGGVATDNKDNVLEVTWELTGNQNSKYTFKGEGDR